MNLSCNDIWASQIGLKYKNWAPRGNLKKIKPLFQM